MGLEGGMGRTSGMGIMAHPLISLNRRTHLAKIHPEVLRDIPEYILSFHKQLLKIAVQDLVKVEHPNLQFKPNQIYCCHFYALLRILSFLPLLARGSQASLHECPVLMCDLYVSQRLLALLRNARGNDATSVYFALFQM